MWSQVAEQMAMPWRMAEARRWRMGKQELARQAAISSSSEDHLGREGVIDIAPQANRLPELRMPIKRETVRLPSFKEMFTDVASTHYTST